MQHFLIAGAWCVNSFSKNGSSSTLFGNMATAPEAPAPYPQHKSSQFIGLFMQFSIYFQL